MNDSAPWLERELARQLAPVAAPESLWRRVREAQRPVGTYGSLRWTVWPAVALLTLLLCVIAFRQISALGTERLTAQDLVQLARTPGDFDFRSNDFASIRSWAKAEADVDIDLPPGRAAESAHIRLLGVRLMRLRGVSVAAIDYRVGNETATLLVSDRRAGLRANSGAGRHLFAATKVDSRRSLISWNMKDQNYAIAFSGAAGLHEACMLCHANIPGAVAIN